MYGVISGVLARPPAYYLLSNRKNGSLQGTIEAKATKLAPEFAWRVEYRGTDNDDWVIVGRTDVISFGVLLVEASLYINDVITDSDYLSCVVRSLKIAAECEIEKRKAEFIAMLQGMLSEAEPNTEWSVALASDTAANELGGFAFDVTGLVNGWAETLRFNSIRPFDFRGDQIVTRGLVYEVENSNNVTAITRLFSTGHRPKEVIG